VFVDYLQKIAMQPEPEHETEKVTRVVEELKDFALSNDVAVVALVAADWDGLRAGRVRLHHLRGSSALAYECDVAVILNEKHTAVARTHLAYDLGRAETFKQHVVFSVEKNRGGPALVDLEFRKDFTHYRFDPRGSYMSERSVDDRLEPA
jgi:replicative DNA helicase